MGLSEAGNLHLTQAEFEARLQVLKSNPFAPPAHESEYYHSETVAWFSRFEEKHGSVLLPHELNLLIGLEGTFGTIEKKSLQQIARLLNTMSFEVGEEKTLDQIKAQVSDHTAKPVQVDAQVKQTLLDRCQTIFDHLEFVRFEAKIATAMGFWPKSHDRGRVPSDLQTLITHRLDERLEALSEGQVFVAQFDFKKP